MPEQHFGWVGYDDEMRDFDKAVEAGIAADLVDVQSEVDAELDRRRALIGTGHRPFTWELEKQLVADGKLAAPFPIHQQDTGNCVAAAIEQLMQQRQVIEVGLFREEEILRPIFTPWIYALSRNQIGGGMRGAGSSGAWGAEAVHKYGVLFSDDPRVPKYAGTSDAWGHKNNAGSLKNSAYAEFASLAQDNKIKIVRWDDDVQKMMEASDLGIMFSIAGDWGFTTRKYKGYQVFVRSGSWSHQMWYSDPIWEPFMGMRRCNQWGENYHPTPINGERPGGGWQLADEIEREARQAVTYGFFSFQGEQADPDPGIM